MNIKTLRFISGEEVIADVVEEQSNEKQIFVKSPIIVQIGVDSNGAVQVRLGLPLIFTGDVSQGLALNRRNILAITDTLDDAKNAYRKQFGDGLILPASDDLVLKV